MADERVRYGKHTFIYIIVETIRVCSEETVAFTVDIVGQHTSYSCALLDTHCKYNHQLQWMPLSYQTTFLLLKCLLQ